MTRRKPPEVPVRSWVEQQIRSAEAHGAFDNLPGKGKPIPDLGRRRPELAWVADYLHREEIEIGGLLPPALALAKEVEDLPLRLRRLTSEARVRSYVSDLNARIRDASRSVSGGPPVRVAPLDVDTVVARWQDVRAELAAARAEAATQARAALAEAAPASTRRRRWWRRRGQRV